MRVIKCFIEMFQYIKPMQSVVCQIMPQHTCHEVKASNTITKVFISLTFLNLLCTNLETFQTLRTTHLHATLTLSAISYSTLLIFLVLDLIFFIICAFLIKVNPTNRLDRSKYLQSILFVLFFLFFRIFYNMIFHLHTKLSIHRQIVTQHRKILCDKKENEIVIKFKRGCLSQSSLKTTLLLYININTDTPLVKSTSCVY